MKEAVRGQHVGWTVVGRRMSVGVGQREYVLPGASRGTLGTCGGQAALHLAP